MSSPSTFLWRVTNSCLVDGQTCQNVLHFTASPGILPATIADTIAAQWLDQIRAFQHAGAVWVTINVRRLDPGDLASFTKPVILPGQGGEERAEDNPVLSRKIWLKSNSGGRHGRGRFYIPGCASGAWDKGRIKSVSLDAGTPILATLAARFTGSAPSTGLNLVIKTKGNSSGAVDVDFLEQAPILGIQRRRNIGVGI